MKMGKTLKKIFGVSVMLTVPLTCQMPTVLAATTAIESDSEDAWKANTGTIILGETITYTGSGVSVSDNIITITEGGDFTVTGTLSDGMIVVNTEDKVKLRLNGVDITNSNGPAIYFQNAKKAFITLEEGTINSLKDGASYTSDLDVKGALFSNDTLEIKGKGTLNITGNYKHGIASDDDIIIENGVININAYAKDGIHANDNITIGGGTLNITTTVDDGIDCEGDIIINDGDITISSADDAIHADADLTVNGGNINVTKCGEGIESKANMTINDGIITITGSDDCLNATSNITINGGQIYCYASNNDAIDSNGTMTINGGTIIAIGSDSPEGGFDCDNNTFSINGGTIIGLGGETSGPTANSCTQASVVLGSYPANSLLHIENESGDDVLTYKIPQSYKTMLISTPKITNNETYTVYTGGNISGATEFNGLYTEGTYTDGTQNTSFNTTFMVTQIGGSIFGGGNMPGGPGGNMPSGGRPGRPEGPGGLTSPSDNKTGIPDDIVPSRLNLSIKNNSSDIANMLSYTCELTADEGNFDLSKVTIRYYYTADSLVTQNTYCDNTGIVYTREPWYEDITNTTDCNIYEMTNITDTADHYLEIGFSKTDKIIDNTATLSADIRIAKEDWSNYTQSNDFSYINGPTLYYDGVLISGYEPN